MANHNQVDSNHSSEDKDWAELERVRQRIIRSIAHNMDLYGITPSVGRLYGTMYFKDKPMTLDEMTDALGMSKTSMSTGVRSLLEIKMVQKTWIRGVRKDLYTVEEDWYKTFVDLFTTKWKKAIAMNELEITESRNVLQRLFDQTEDPSLKEEIEKDLHKLNHAIEYYDWLKRLVKSFETGEIFEFIPKK